jgi:hypothetical protein
VISYLNERGGQVPAALVLFVALLGAACSGAPAGDLAIALAPATPTRAASIRVSGLSSAELSALRGAPLDHTAWNAILSVHVGGNDSLPVAGTYTVAADTIEFTPRFAFDPGRTYIVRVDSSRFPQPRQTRIVTKEVQVPSGPEAPRTSVAAIAPTGGVWPENILRFYIQFSAPMSRSTALGFVRLVDDAGAEVREAFLPLDVDLWNGDRTRFTVFFDPGRVKTGIRPNVELGRALHAGRAYAIVVDPAWPDAHGRPLASRFRYSFRASAAEERPVQPADWSIAVPAANTRNPLVVAFPWALDHGLLQRTIGVVADGQTLDGTIAVDEGERSWRFTPSAAWRAGTHQLSVLSILEDPAGNRVGRAFEIEMFQKPAPDAGERVSVRFDVR